MSLIWKDRPALEDQRRRAMQASNPDRPTYDAHLRRGTALADRTAGRSDAGATAPDSPASPFAGRSIDREPDRIPPRVRVNVKQLANGKWQPEITVESFDGDPDTPEGREIIFRRLDGAKGVVDAAIAYWEGGADG